MGGQDLFFDVHIKVQNVIIVLTLLYSDDSQYFEK